MRFVPSVVVLVVLLAGVRGRLLAGLRARLLALLRARLLALLRARLLAGLRARLLARLRARLLVGVRARLLALVRARLLVGVLAGVRARLLVGMRVRLLAGVRARLLVGVRARLLAGVRARLLGRALARLLGRALARVVAGVVAVVVAGALAGCDGLFGLPHVPDRTDGGLGVEDDAGFAGVDARPGCMLDTFSSGMIGFGELWNRELTPSASDVVVESGRLAIKIAPGANVFGFAFTNREYDLTGATVTVRVDRVIGRGDAETFFELESGGDDSYYFAYVDGVLQMRLSRGDTDEQIRDIPYDPVEHVYWRFRHDVGRKAVVYSTSGDGVTWIERHAIATSLAMTAMLVEVGAGVYSDSVPDAVSLFDDVELCLGT